MFDTNLNWHVCPIWWRKKWRMVTITEHELTLDSIPVEFFSLLTHCQQLWDFIVINVWIYLTSVYGSSRMYPLIHHFFHVSFLSLDSDSTWLKNVRAITGMSVRCARRYGRTHSAKRPVIVRKLVLPPLRWCKTSRLVNWRHIFISFQVLAKLKKKLIKTQIFDMVCRRFPFLT